MAKYQITRSCGHTETVNIGGPVKNRDYLAEKEAEKLCLDCYRAKQAQQRATENQASATANQASGLPALQGTEKQVAWAETIRAKVHTSLSALQHQLQANLDSGKGTMEQQSAARTGIEIIRATLARTSAAEWIDGRDTAMDRDWLIRQVKAAQN